MGDILTFPRKPTVTTGTRLIQPGDKVNFRSGKQTLRGSVHQIVQRAKEYAGRTEMTEAYVVSVQGTRHHVIPENIIVPSLPEDGVA